MVWRLERGGPGGKLHQCARKGRSQTTEAIHHCSLQVRLSVVGRAGETDGVGASLPGRAESALCWREVGT